MNITLDIVLPPIIVGMLILLVLTLNTKMMESQTSNRLTADMQGFANSTLNVLQEELRGVQEVIAITDSTLRYTNAAFDTVSVYRSQRNLHLRRVPFGGGLADTTILPGRLSAVRFTMPQPAVLRVRLQSRSQAAEEIDGTPSRLRAFAERDFYLRNLTP